MCLASTSEGAFPVVAGARRRAVNFLPGFSREASTKRRSGIQGILLVSLSMWTSLN